MDSSYEHFKASLKKRLERLEKHRRKRKLYQGPPPKHVPTAYHFPILSAEDIQLVKAQIRSEKKREQIKKLIVSLLFVPLVILALFALLFYMVL